MSTLSIPPISSVSSGVELAGTNSPGLQQTAFNNLLSRLQQAISAGNLSTSRLLLNALDALPPTGVAETTALTNFLTGVGAALANGSIEDAQNALSTFHAATSQTAQNSPPSVRDAASSEVATAASTIAANLVQSQLQLNLVSALLMPPGSSTPADSTATGSVSSLIAFLNTAYGTSQANSSASASTAQSPYDMLVSALTSNLSKGISTAGPALAYLQSKGSLVSMEG